MSTGIIETEFLIVGAGPAGASLACFLGQNGLKGLVISSAPSTADTPRAHILNPFARECLRDIGLERDAACLATDVKALQAHRFVQSLSGAEYGKVQAWGGSPDSARDIARASPCAYIDLPQDMLEPLLVTNASLNGFSVRFSTQLTEAVRDEDGVHCSVVDLLTKQTFKIRTKHLFGADGGRSTVAHSLGFVFQREPSQGVAINVLFKADVEHLLPGREAQLHWIVNPAKASRFGAAPLIRIVRPPKEWMLVVFSPGATEAIDKVSPDDPELVDFIKGLIGDPDVDVEVSRVDGWVVRETAAEKLSLGRDTFILGDAAHRHPPTHGLGSNTCIQDAYNLAWKVAYVAKGLAGPGLLDTYSHERQPVGASLVKEANQCLRETHRALKALGLSASSPEEGARLVSELYASTDEGTALREELFQALEGKRREGEGLGLAMNQFYASGAVFLDDEDGPRPEVLGDPTTTIQISTYPGGRLPHAWLATGAHSKKVSTHDVAGHGCFSLFYGRGGEAWAQAAQAISSATGIPIKACGIGFGLGHHDVYRDWRRLREVGEDGCVLVRPDRFVAWRANKMVTPRCEDKLKQVMNQVLFRGNA